jgi:hypothetical protein
MRRQPGRGAHRSRCGRGGAAPIRGRATFRSKCRTPTSSFPRRPITARWRTSSFRSRRRICGSSAAAGPARSPSASSASPRRSPASTCGSTPAACASYIGTRPPNGPTCSMAAPASPPSTRTVATSSTMSASATSGTSPRASRIRSRGSSPTAASSCWCSTTAASPRTTPSCSATGSGTCRRTCSARISASRRRTSATRRIRASSTSFLCRCRGRLPPTALPAPRRCRTRSAIA